MVKGSLRSRASRPGKAEPRRNSPRTAKKTEATKSSSSRARSTRDVAGSDTAEQHRKARAARSHEIAHDYVEVIAELTDETGEARAIDIARRLGVSHVTVNRTISRLQRQGLAVAEPYRAIFLTEEGRSLARQVKARHDTVLEFLRALGIKEEVARVDAEGIEHHVSAETLRAFDRFTASRRRGKGS